MKKIKLNKGRALIIVAHPDDETIWMGGTILNNPKVRWTILCLCRQSDSDRAPKFLKAARKKYKAKGIIYDLDDENKLTPRQSMARIRKIITEYMMKSRKFDYIFTHGKNGEYGHDRHMEAHRVIKKMIIDKKIKVKKTFFFSYKFGKKNGRRKVFNYLKNTNYYFRLSLEDIENKKNIIKKLYGFSKSSFENRSCLPLETFTYFQEN